MHREGAYRVCSIVGVYFLHNAGQPCIGSDPGDESGSRRHLRDGIRKGGTVGLLIDNREPMRIDIAAMQIHTHQTRPRS